VALAEVALQTARLQVEQARVQAERARQNQAMDVILAQSKVEQLDLQLAQLRAHPPTAEVVAAQVNLDRARDALDAARIEHQKALDRSWEPQSVRDAHAKAVWHAELELQVAQARLYSAVAAQRAHELGVEGLAAQRDLASTQLTQTLDSEVAYTITFALLEAEVRQAQLQLDGLRAWENPYLDPPDPSEIAQARALLRQAELAVEQLVWQLQGAKLYAPCEGVISAVYLRPGEWGAPGAPAVTVLDAGRWYVETRNVGELSIGRVRVGQQAEVEVLAFQGETLPGQIESISPVAVVQQGDTTYTLMIALEPTEVDLWPGMNVKVNIQTEGQARP
jgi:multidrug resistance efflux pump